MFLNITSEKNQIKVSLSLAGDDNLAFEPFFTVNNLRLL